MKINVKMKIKNKYKIKDTDFVIGSVGRIAPEKSFDKLSIIEHVNLYIKEGKDIKEAMKIVAKERSVPKNVIYNEYHKKEKF